MVEPETKEGTETTTKDNKDNTDEVISDCSNFSIHTGITHDYAKEQDEPEPTFESIAEKVMTEHMEHLEAIYITTIEINKKLDELIDKVTKILNPKPAVKTKETPINTYKNVDVSKQLETNQIPEVKTTVAEFMKSHVNILPHTGSKASDKPENKKISIDEYWNNKTPKSETTPEEISTEPAKKKGGRPKKQKIKDSQEKADDQTDNRCEVVSPTPTTHV